MSSARTRTRCAAYIRRLQQLEAGGAQSEKARLANEFEIGVAQCRAGKLEEALTLLRSRVEAGRSVPTRHLLCDVSGFFDGHRVAAALP